MRKVIIALFAVGLLAQAIMAISVFTWADTGTVRNVPYGQRVIDLHTRNTGESNDTMLTTDINVYGPYELCNDGDILPTKFYVQADVATGTTPVLALDYQLIGGKSLADTVSAWIACDTIAEAAFCEATTIEGAGMAIVFRVNNYDGSTSVIPGLLRVIIPSGITNMLKR